jgi:DNA-binding MarR family transcriptional regulator
MPSSNNVHNTHISSQLAALHSAVLDIVAVMNRPQRDELLIQAAGIKLDRALFPLLIGIERFGPIGVVEAADRLGRDYTTVSRQVAKLESLGLVGRRASAADKRVREAVATPAGEAMTDRIDAARERILGGVFADWSGEELESFTRLTRRFADAIRDQSAGAA